METTNENKKLYPLIKGWNELKAKDQPKVRDEICEYFASKNKQAKGGKIGRQAWNNRLKGHTSKIEDIEFIKTVFKKYGVNQPIGKA